MSKRTPAPLSFVGLYPYIRGYGPLANERYDLVGSIKHSRNPHQVLAPLRSLYRPEAEALFSGATLVPVPGSKSHGYPGASHALAHALAGAFGGRAAALLARTQSVSRSSQASSREGRPTVDQHYKSIEVDEEQVSKLGEPSGSKQLVLVDDVITLGRTVFACAHRLRKRFPEVRVVGFAAFYPLGNRPYPRALLTPVAGSVRVRVVSQHPSKRKLETTVAKDLDLEAIRAIWTASPGPYCEGP